MCLVAEELTHLEPCDMFSRGHSCPKSSRCDRKEKCFSSLRWEVVFMRGASGFNPASAAYKTVEICVETKENAEPSLKPDLVLTRSFLEGTYEIQLQENAHGNDNVSYFSAQRFCVRALFSCNQRRRTIEVQEFGDEPFSRGVRAPSPWNVFHKGSMFSACGSMKMMRDTPFGSHPLESLKEKRTGPWSHNATDADYPLCFFCSS